MLFQTHEVWLAKFENSAKNYLSEVKSASQQSPPSPAKSDASDSVVELENKNTQLQALVTHYKKIIQDTEGMLNNLQNHIEQEEIRWNQQLEKKQVEIDSLKKDQESLVERLNSQVSLQVKYINT